MTRVLCLGGGGHAAVVVDALLALAARGLATPVGIVTRDGRPGDVLGVPVLGSDDDLALLSRRAGAEAFVVGVGSLRGGDPLRERIFQRCIELGLRQYTLVHPAAVVSASARLGAGAAVMAGAVIQARAAIGENAIVNTRASVDHDCVVLAHAHVAPGATLSGGVRVGRSAHVGTGASVRNGVSIGDGATIGAGAALVRDCPPGAVMVGVPARLVVGRRSDG